jgi:formylglycine-generating enzyme required for sulfatase activity
MPYPRTLCVFAIATLTVAPLAAADPVVENVMARPAPDSREVEITYDLVDEDSDTLYLSLEISNDGGNSFRLPAHAFSGDVGLVTPGRGKRVTWTVTADVAEAVGDRFQARVTASEEPPGMVPVPAGVFPMGSPSGDQDETPVHDVFLDAFLIDRNLVTGGQYRTFLHANGRGRPTFFETGDITGRLPVVAVDWFDARDYCQWLGKRLPTEAEWEKAARGTDGRTYPWGDEIDHSLANYGGGPGRTTEVGSYETGVSPYGVYDMAGNVWQWLSDWYDGGYYAVSPGRNPQGPESGTFRILRGGSWGSNPYSLRSTYRIRNEPAITGGFIGFRCVQGAD